MLSEGVCACAQTTFHFGRNSTTAKFLATLARYLILRQLPIATMFAVKGWNIDAASLKPQTENRNSTNGRTGGQKGSKKRRRGEDSDARGDDVGQLWDQHIEGKEPVKVKTKPKDNKRQKRESEGDGKSDNDKAYRKPEEKRPRSDPGAVHDGIVEKPPRNEVKRDKKVRKSESTVAKDSARHPDKSHAVKIPATAVPAPSPKTSAAAKLTPMQSAMRQKLISARFRHLNQTLYTEPSAKALELFASNPEMFEDYHSGFRQQVAVWPENPVDNFIATLQSRGGVRMPSQKKAFKDKKRHREPAETMDVSDARLPALPRTQGTCIIADLGCGDARLAQTLKNSGDGQKLQLKVLSYDLHSPSSLVTKADISKIPTADGSVDVAIFCLALMGTNWISFIEEAYRILHWKGELWVAEIKSRFGRVGKAGKPVEHSVGGKRKQAAIQKAQEAKKRETEEVNEQDALAVEVDGVETQNVATDVSAFVDVLKRRGFLLKNDDSSIDLSNKMFVKMEFVKAAAATKGKNVQEKQGAKPNDRFKKPRAKFLEENENEATTDDEAKVLKPCLYKIR